MKNRSAIPSRKIITVARRLGIPEAAWARHIKCRKDVAYPIVFSFAQSLRRFGVEPHDFFRILHS